MMTPYLLRLFCLCLAVFFVIHSGAGLVAALIGPAAVRTAGRMRPRSAARFLLALRLLPALLALFVVAGLCVPSYLWLETEKSVEEVGAGCLAAAVLAAILWTMSTVRGVRGAARSFRYARSCENLGRLSTQAESHAPVWIMDARQPFLALLGVFRSRVVISSPAVRALSAGQLNAALRHEDAHRVSRDNLKRLVMLLSPHLLPGLHGFDAIERGWARYSEWAADDVAAAGDAHRSLDLAAALVRIARMGVPAAPPPLATLFLGDTREISQRVDRLLSLAPRAPAGPRSVVGVFTALVLAAGSAACMLHPATLESAHRIIEQLIH